MSREKGGKPIDLPLCYKESKRVPVLLVGVGMPGTIYAEKKYGPQSAFAKNTKQHLSFLDQYNASNDIARGIDYFSTDHHRIIDKQVDLKKKTRTELISEMANIEFQYLQFAWADADAVSPKSFLKGLKVDIFESDGVRLDGEKFSDWWQNNLQSLPRELTEARNFWRDGNANGIIAMFSKGSKVPSINAWMKSLTRKPSFVALLVSNTLVRNPSKVLKDTRKFLLTSPPPSESKRSNITPSPQDDELSIGFGQMSLNDRGSNKRKVKIESKGDFKNQGPRSGSSRAESRSSRSGSSRSRAGDLKNVNIDEQRAIAASFQKPVKSQGFSSAMSLI